MLFCHTCVRNDDEKCYVYGYDVACENRSASKAAAIDDPANWGGNGYASIELYTPFDPDAAKFTVKTWYPIIRKQEAST